MVRIDMNREEIQEYIVDLRREFHMHPELSGQEEWTSARICEELSAASVPYEIYGHRNVIGRIENGEGRRIAFRADFDALPVEELVDVPWKSRNPECMHACGHDAHAACLLGMARLLMENKDRWKGTVYLCFQHGEETGKGADECVRYLKNHGGVDAVFAAHMLSILPSGMIVLQPGAVATGGIIFRIEIEGTSGHGGRPDLAISAADIMCDIYQHLVSIPSNRHEAAKTCVISPCVLNSGSRFNVIPDSAVIEGTIRFLGEDDGEILMEKVRRTSEAIASMHGGRAEVIYDEVAKYPVINDADMSAVGRKAAERLGFSLFDTEPTSASDNFAEFLHEYPGYYCFVGSKSDRKGTSGVHHAPDFDLDESVLHMVPELFFETTLSLMN